MLSISGHVAAAVNSALIPWCTYGDFVDTLLSLSLFQVASSVAKLTRGGGSKPLTRGGAVLPGGGVGGKKRTSSASPSSAASANDGPGVRLGTLLCSPCSRVYRAVCRRKGRALHSASSPGAHDDDGDDDAAAGGDGEGATPSSESSDILRSTTPRGTRGRVPRARAARVVDILESDGMNGRDTVTAGDLASLAGLPLSGGCMQGCNTNLSALFEYSTGSA